MRNLLTRLVALGLLAVSLPTAAELRIVATTPGLGMLAREVAGSDSQIKVLTTPEQNAHHVQARPSIMAALRSADLLIAVGADLEAAWMMPAVTGAANPKIRPSRQGYFEAAAEVTLIGAGKPADRRLGDVHPEGNPHVTMDPVRTGVVAEALGRRLAELDPGNAARYTERAAAVRDRLESVANALRAKVPAGISAVLYHPDADYLMQRLGVPVVGYVEPLPGIPPTARHLAELSRALSGARGVIFHAPYHPEDGPRRLAELPGWRVVMLPIEPPVDAGLEDYVQLLERWVDALAGES